MYYDVYYDVYYDMYYVLLDKNKTNKIKIW